MGLLSLLFSGDGSVLSADLLEENRSLIKRG